MFIQSNRRWFAFAVIMLALGLTAAAQVAEYEKDDAFMAKVTKAKAESDAGRHLIMAQNYLKAGRKAQAIAECDEILMNYPDTDAAKQAAQVKQDAGKAE